MWRLNCRLQNFATLGNYVSNKVSSTCARAHHIFHPDKFCIHRMPPVKIYSRYPSLLIFQSFITSLKAKSESYIARVAKCQWHHKKPKNNLFQAQRNWKKIRSPQTDFIQMSFSHTLSPRENGVKSPTSRVLG